MIIELEKVVNKLEKYLDVMRNTIPHSIPWREAENNFQEVLVSKLRIKYFKSKEAFDNFVEGYSQIYQNTMGLKNDAS